MKGVSLGKEASMSTHAQRPAASWRPSSILHVFAAVVAATLATACGAASSEDASTEDALAKASCKAVTQLTCGEGQVITTDGCKQPSAPAAASVAHGRCVADGCKVVTQLTCSADEVIATDGCKQPS